MLEVYRNLGDAEATWTNIFGEKVTMYKLRCMITGEYRYISENMLHTVNIIEGIGAGMRG